MLERKTFQALFLAALTFLTLYSLTRAGNAQLGRAETRVAVARDQATPDCAAALREELQAAAKEHGVSIDAGPMVYAGAASSLIAVAPIKGLEKYGEAEFAKGAPIHLVLVKSAIKGGLPDGSYVVRAQYRPGADSGGALFTDRGGAVVRGGSSSSGRASRQRYSSQTATGRRPSPSSTASTTESIRSISNGLPCARCFILRGRFRRSLLH